MLTNEISATSSGAISVLNCFAYLTSTGVRMRTTTSFNTTGENTPATMTTA